MSFRPLLLAIVAATRLLCQPVVTNLRVDDNNSNGGHSSLRITWDTDAAPDNQRIQWGPTRSLGRVYYVYGPSYAPLNQQLVLSGLETETDLDGDRNVYFCAQSHNAAGWSECKVQSAKIGAVPETHPSLAILPQAFAIAQPPSDGCTVQTASHDLSDLQEKVDSAVKNQPSNCQIIDIPPGASGSVYVNFAPAADADQIPLSGIDVVGNRLKPSTAINALPNGSRVRLGGAIYEILPAGLNEGEDYCIADSSGEPGSAFQLQEWPECSGVVPLQSAGSETLYVIPYPPPHSNYIQIRNASTKLPPEGVRVTPEWKSGGANTVKWMPNSVGPNSGSAGAFYVSGTAHHIYIGPGIDFTQKDSGQIDTTDPIPWPPWFTTRASADHIAVKQNWFTGLGFPERTFRALAPEGSYVDISDNFLDKIDFWRPMKSGLVPVVQSPTMISVSAGAYHTGLGNCATVPGFTANTASSTSGTAYLTIRPNDCAPVITIPEGATVNCSGCETRFGNGFPVNASGRYAHALVGTCSFNAGVWTSCTNFDDFNTGGFSVTATEGPSNIISLGPGPFRIANNYESSHGIFWHMDDTAFVSGHATPRVMQRDLTFARNVFATPDRYRFGSLASDGLVYSNRNQWECKRCERVLLSGNEFYGNYADVNQGPTIIINGNAAFSSSQTPVQSYAGDLTIDRNFIHDTSSGIQIGGGPPNASNVPQLGRRFKLTGNLLYNVNGLKYFSPKPTGRQNAWGYCFEFSFGAEDVISDHNTCSSMSGSLSVGLLFVSKMIEGFQFTNNSLNFATSEAAYDWGSAGVGNPNCGASTSTLGLSCALNGHYTFTNNILNLIAPSVGADSTNTGSSILLPGGLNTKIGYNKNSLEDALGWVRNIVARLSPGGALIGFHAPDSAASCQVGYGTSPDPTTWQLTAPDSSISQQRSIAIQGLSSGTSYYYQVLCGGSAPSATLTLAIPKN